MTALAALCAALAALLLVAPGTRPGRADPGPVPVADTADLGWMHRFRVVWSALGALGAWGFFTGTAGLVLAPVVGAVIWVLIGRSEPVGVRRERELIRTDLPHVVGLLGSALQAGAAPAAAAAVVCAALPGPATARLQKAVARLALGVDPGEVWEDLSTEPALAPLGRTLARAHHSGAPVAVAVDRLAEELAATGRADVEDRARAVGVRAALPLGLCLLPAFILIGIVPLVAGLLSGLVL